MKKYIKADDMNGDSHLEKIEHCDKRFLLFHFYTYGATGGMEDLLAWTDDAHAWDSLLADCGESEFGDYHFHILDRTTMTIVKKGSLEKDIEDIL